jgi:pimeloyl-ACP methyl ester carboxylesterase
VTAPLVLESFRSQYIGGRRVAGAAAAPTSVALSPGLTSYTHDPSDTIHVEQAYVQSWVPAGRSQQTPVLLVAGGGLTGSCWETTPDGRDGWLLSLLRAGIPVDVLDNVERGRAGWPAVPGLWAGDPIQRGEKDMWANFRVGRPEDYPARRPFAGSRFPVDALDAMLCQSVPRWPANDLVALETLATVLATLGPRVVVGHSHGGGLVARVACRTNIAVTAAVLVEPHGLPDASDLRPDHPPVALVEGDFLDRSTLWVELMPRIREYEASLRHVGVRVHRFALPAMGITGNSHNPMMDTNSTEVADLLIAWLARQRADGAFA